ncbi:hypothetical protein L596_012666 [Steinernema carpocapsae]|uniref:7TM GPCR serpentine receptor class x (Srx) domain-containing protein n=1 Tax=Steinernema carpocapsae TaxID=34508 RepID=A0A4U5NYM2_STECR|nr:hypothetical protein L596_012666 [Steinernema carpocapsae]
MQIRVIVLSITFNCLASAKKVCFACSPPNTLGSIIVARINTATAFLGYCITIGVFHLSSCMLIKLLRLSRIIIPNPVQEA